MPKTIDRDKLIAYLDDYLDAHERGDYGPNGLQVQGTATIRKVVTGVSSCRELFKRAADTGADAVLVHHGIFWDGMPYPLTGVQHGRVAALVKADLNLVAYHLPLDRHPDVGNNALAVKELGMVEREPFAETKGQPIGYYGRFPEPISIDELVRRALKVYGQEPLTFRAGPDTVRTLGIVSGGAQKELYSAIELGLDAFLTGEVSEWVMNLAREAGIHFLSAGHYATERLGIRALGRHVHERFGIEVEFIDVPNPV